MGKKSPAPTTPAQSPAETTTARIAEDIFNETTPLRQSFLNQWQNTYQKGMESTAMSPLFSAMRRPIEDQYDVAKQNILASTPQGGALNEGLALTEAERSGKLSDLISQLYADELNKAYGYVSGVPAISLSGLGSASNAFASRYGANAAAGANMYGTVGGMVNTGIKQCCFNFLEAEGEIHSDVRRYRDEHFSESGPVSRGYIRTALHFVPWMRKNRAFKQLVRLTMTQPLKAYAQWHYGANFWGFMGWPAKFFWIHIWRLLGGGVK